MRYMVANPEKLHVSFDTLLHNHKQEICNQCHPNLYLDGIMMDNVLSILDMFCECHMLDSVHHQSILGHIHCVVIDL